MATLSDPYFLPRKEAVDGSYSLSIDEVCDHVSSGDIILFSGASWTSFFVTMFCASQWSHIGIIYKNGTDPPRVFESIKSDDDGSKNYDVRTGKPRVGVRLVDLRALLTSFTGHAIAIRPLTTPRELNLHEFLAEHMTKSLEWSIKTYGMLPYEHRWLNFIFARFDIIKLHCEVPDALFCSELVARCLQEAGLMDGTHSSLQYLPDDFSQVGSVDLTYPRQFPFVSLSASVRLGPELFVELPKRKKSAWSLL